LLTSASEREREVAGVLVGRGPFLTLARRKKSDEKFAWGEPIKVATTRGAVPLELLFFRTEKK
jgi:hypothetical protein